MLAPFLLPGAWLASPCAPPLANITHLDNLHVRAGLEEGVHVLRRQEYEHWRCGCFSQSSSSVSTAILRYVSSMKTSNSSSTRILEGWRQGGPFRSGLHIHTYLCSHTHTHSHTHISTYLSIYLSISICICIHICIYICIYMSYIYIYIYLYTYIHICRHTYVYIYPALSVHLSIIYQYVCMHSCVYNNKGMTEDMHECTNKYRQTDIHTHTHARTQHTDIHIHIHIYISIYPYPYQYIIYIHK